MLSLLVPIVAVLTAVAALPYTRGRRAAALVAALAGGVWVFVGTEVLSSFRGLTRTNLAVWWAIGAVLAAVGAWRARGSWGQWFDGLRGGGWRDRLRGFGTLNAVLLAVILANLAYVTVVAIFAAPNNFDTLSYHMPRQVRWMQDRTVAYFPANDPRLLHMPPFAEFVGVDLMILSGGDFWASLIQTAALVGCLLAGSLAVRELGGARLAQLVACALIVTCVPVFFQATTQKNDIVLTLWLLILLWVVLRSLRERRFGWFDGVAVGLCLGLAGLTKGTAAVYGPAPAVLAAVAVLRARPRGKAFAAITLVPVLVAVINAPHTYRNWRAYHWPTGPHVLGTYSVQMYDNAMHTPAVFVSNLVRNSTLHLAVPNAAVNHAMQSEVERLHRWLGLAPDDPRTTYMDQKYDVVYLPQFEDRAGDLAHFLLLLALPVLALLVRRRLPGGWLFWAALAVPYVSAALFCMYLSWQPWHARLHIPLFCYAAIPTGIVLEIGALRRAVPFVLAGLLVNLAPPMIEGPRPLLGPRSVLTMPRREQYGSQFFAVDQKPFVETIDWIGRSGMSVLGIHTAHGQYAIERILLDESPRWRFVYPFPRLPLPPDAPPEPVAELVMTDMPTAPALVRHSQDAVWALVYRNGKYSVYARTDLAGRVPVDTASLTWAGMDAVSGLGATEPADPAHGFPPSRMAFDDDTRFVFSGFAGVPLRLEFRGLVNPAVGTIRATLDGRPMFTFTSPPEASRGVIGFFHDFTPTRSGIGRIEFRYEPPAGGRPAPPGQARVRYFGLHLLPDIPALYGPAASR